MIYLASPYSHEDPAVMEQRYHDACKATALLIKYGFNVFSPIAHSHALVEHGAPTDWTAWERVDLDMLSRCDSLLVLLLDGWRNSVGIAAEVKHAEMCGKPVLYLSRNDVEDVTLTRCAIKSYLGDEP